MSALFPRIGIGVLIRREGKVLMGERIGRHHSGTWGPPGGHLEYGETPEACALREVAEECGLEASLPWLGAVTNDFFPDGKHYITLRMVCDWISGEPQNLEPDKQHSWGWYNWSNLPGPLFLSMENLVKSSFNPFTAQPTVYFSQEGAI